MGARPRPARHGHHQLAADVAVARDGCMYAVPPCSSASRGRGRSGRLHGRARRARKAYPSHRRNAAAASAAVS
eukprot:7296158-Prymnesium_polylepis.1